MRNGEIPTHVMRWCPQDYLASPLRGLLAMERDHLSRMVFLELLGKLHESGGELARAEIAGALLITQEEAEHALSRLLSSGRIVEENGVITNPRVTADLLRFEQYSADQAQRGKKGGEATQKRKRASAKQALSKRQATVKQVGSLAVAVAGPLPGRAVAVAGPLKGGRKEEPPALPPADQAERAIRMSTDALRTKLYALVTRAGELDPEKRDATELMREFTTYDRSNGSGQVKGVVNAALLTHERLERSIEDAEAVIARWQHGQV